MYKVARTLEPPTEHLQWRYLLLDYSKQEVPITRHYNTTHSAVDKGRIETMSATEAHKDVVRSYYEKLWNDQNFDLVSEIIAEGEFGC